MSGEKYKQWYQKEARIQHALMNMSHFFLSTSTLCLHHHSVPGLIFSSFAGPPSDLATIVHCGGNSNYDIIRVESGTYKAENLEGTGGRISAGKGIAETLLQSQLPPITIKQDK